MDVMLVGAAEGGPVGKVVRVIPSLDPQTRRIPIEVLVPADPSLTAHAFARARITSPTPVSAWKLPRAAVVARPDFSVFVVTGPTATPSRVVVEVLEESGDDVIVRGALTDGALLVLNPPSTLGTKG